MNYLPGGSDGEASAGNAGDLGSIPGLGRSGEGNGNPLQCSCLGIGGFHGGSDGKASAWNVGGLGSIPGLGRSGEGNGNQHQYSCLENPMDGGAWRLQSMGSQRVGQD